MLNSKILKDKVVTVSVPASLPQSSSHPSVRLDLALLEALNVEGKREISRASLKTFFHEKRVLWRGSPAMPSQLIPPGIHEITILGFDTESTTSQKAAHASADFSCPILYEDDELFIVHKPSGVPSAPLDASATNTAVNFAVSRCPSIATIGRNDPEGRKKGLEPGLLHRLDTGTSGLLVFAKTQAEFDRMSSVWKDRAVQKFYRALVPGTQSPATATPLTIDFPIAHDSHSAKKMIAIQPSNAAFVTKSIRGKPLRAVTRVLSVHHCTIVDESLFQNESQSLLDFEIEIETGVMHQIRCHLSASGWSILGDPIYKGIPSSRLWLHAWRLVFPLSNGTLLTLEAALPEGWPDSGPL